MLLLLCPGRGAVYCDQFVCLSVHKHISGTAGPIITKFVVQISCGRGSVLLWRRCDMLCTSGFMDDVTFRRSGPYGDAWLVALRYRGGVWCLWMPCCILSFVKVCWLSAVSHVANFVYSDVSVYMSCVQSVFESEISRKLIYVSLQTL